MSIATFVLDEYMKQGWVASDKERAGASKTSTRSTIGRSPVRRRRWDAWILRSSLMSVPGTGKTFSIVAENLSDANGYVGAVRLNGQPLSRAYLRHDEILKGRELRFIMQAHPNKSWATDPHSRPYSMSSYQ